MASPTLIYLPGLHGTADLAEPFLQVLPTEIRCKVVVYPLDELLSYDALLGLICDQLRDETEMVIVGESFSGPLALMFAAANPDRVVAVVLSATFARHPFPSWLRHLAVPALCRSPIPDCVIRFVAAGPGLSDAYVDQIRQAIRKPAAAVIALRLKCALTIDCMESLQRCRVPILYLAPTKDHFIPKHCREHICAIRPDTDVQFVDGPHLILQSAPMAAWNLIKRFWNAVNA